MNDNKFEEVKDMVVGEVKETTGKIMDDEEMELKGKFQKGMGKAREVVGDVVHEMEDVKDTVVGGVKEYAGKLTDDNSLQLKGKLQKDKADSEYTNKILGGLGVLAGLYAVKRMFRRNKD
ncbi:MAG: CsbD family protein [Erysipelothrix sp.]|nr:CsbD family protein [Erysipelothrix sp.]